jgi:polysaccharide biosynthesis/export protein
MLCRNQYLHIKAISYWIVAGLLLLASSGQASLAQEPPTDPLVPASPALKKEAATPTGAGATEDDGRYRIGPGDVLEIRVYNRPQLSLEATRVDGRGLIRMPLIEDDIQAACRTEHELARAIATLYLEYQRNPQVFVHVKEYNSQPVAVIGAVDKPGRFQLQRRVRLLELISLVGGPTDKAGQQVQITHSPNSLTCDREGNLVKSDPEMNRGINTNADEYDIYTLQDTLQGDLQSNPFIRPGDVVTIPEAEEAYVVGNVFKPSPISLKMTTTVTQAIAMAGGVLPDSNVNRVRIIRQVPGASIKSERFISLKAINQHQAEDLTLLPGDIIEVQTLSGRKFLRTMLSSLGPAMANLPFLIIR